jgi:putative addiction module component (TIGR02574 family)
MMMDTAKLLEEAMKLSPDERAVLAASLLDSLHEPPEPGYEEAWAEEIARRLREIEAGTAQLIPWPEARRRLMGE